MCGLKGSAAFLLEKVFVLVELLIMFVPNFHLPIPLMTMTQEVLPPIHLLFLSLKITLVRDCFRPELQICGIVLLMLILVLIIFP